LGAKSVLFKGLIMSVNKSLILLLIFVFNLYFFLIPSFSKRVIYDKSYKESRSLEKNIIALDNIKVLDLKEDIIYAEVLFINNRPSLLRPGTYKICVFTGKEGQDKKISQFRPVNIFFPYREKKIKVQFLLKEKYRSINIFNDTLYIQVYNTGHNPKKLSLPIEMTIPSVFIKKFEKNLEMKNFHTLKNILLHLDKRSSQEKNDLRKRFEPFQKDLLILIEKYSLIDKKLNKNILKSAFEQLLKTDKVIEAPKTPIISDPKIVKKKAYKQDLTKKNIDNLTKQNIANLTKQNIAKQNMIKQVVRKQNNAKKVIALENNSAISGFIKVKWGDSLYSLARNHYGNGRDYTKIAFLNSLEPPYIIKPGQKLRIFSDHEIQASKAGCKKKDINISLPFKKEIVLDNTQITDNTKFPDSKKTVRTDQGSISTVQPEPRGSEKDNAVKLAEKPEAEKPETVKEFFSDQKEGAALTASGDNINKDNINKDINKDINYEHDKELKEIFQAEIREIEVNASQTRTSDIRESVSLPVSEILKNNLPDQVSGDVNISGTAGNIKKSADAGDIKDSPAKDAPVTDTPATDTPAADVLAADKAVAGKTDSPKIKPPDDKASHNTARSDKSEKIVVSESENNQNIKNRYLKIIIMMLVLLFLVFFLNYIRKVRRAYQLKLERSRFYDESMSTRF
jgi:nucleoid-associated protein YgaU